MAISLQDNVFRIGSKKYLQLFAEARMLNEWKTISLDENSKFLIENTDIGKFGIYEGKKVPLDIPKAIEEAEYQGKEVPIGKPKRGGSKAYYVYVMDGDKVKKVSFGSGGLRAKIKDPKARQHLLLDTIVIKRKIEQQQDIGAVTSQDMPQHSV